MAYKVTYVAYVTYVTYDVHVCTYVTYNLVFTYVTYNLVFLCCVTYVTYSTYVTCHALVPTTFCSRFIRFCSHSSCWSQLVLDGICFHL